MVEGSLETSNIGVNTGIHGQVLPDSALFLPVLLHYLKRAVFTRLVGASSAPPRPSAPRGLAAQSPASPSVHLYIPDGFRLPLPASLLPCTSTHAHRPADSAPRSAQGPPCIGGAEAFAIAGAGAGELSAGCPCLGLAERLFFLAVWFPEPHRVITAQHGLCTSLPGASPAPPPPLLGTACLVHGVPG